MNTLPEYVQQRIRRPYPVDGHVVPHSTPVISFGNPSACRVATLGINPSRIEFQTQSRTLLPVGKKRLVDLELLDATDLSTLNDRQVELVVSACHNYFHRNPYGRWFDKLNAVLAGIDCDYYTGSACHLDIVQWATDPVWGSFPRSSRTAQQQLLHDDSEFLLNQLCNESIELVLVNGRTVAEWLGQSGIAYLGEVGTPPLGKQGKRASLLRGAAHGVLFLGWTLNANHSQTTPQNRAALARWLGENWQV